MGHVFAQYLTMCTVLTLTLTCPTSDYMGLFINKFDILSLIHFLIVELFCVLLICKNPTKNHAIFIHKIHSCLNLQTILGLNYISHTVQCICTIHLWNSQLLKSADNFGAKSLFCSNKHC